LKAALAQALHRFFPGRFVGTAGARGPLLLEAARANERLSQIYYMENAKVQSMNAAVTALNLAERVGDSPELARSYSNVTVTTAVMLLYRWSAMYERLALGLGRT